MSKATESSFTEYVIHAMLSSSDSNLFICYSVLPGDTQDAPLPIAICDGQCSAFSLVLLLVASALYRRIDRTIVRAVVICCILDQESTIRSQAVSKIGDLKVKKTHEMQIRQIVPNGETWT